MSSTSSRMQVGVRTSPGRRLPAPGRAQLAFAGLILFIVLVYTNPSNLFPVIGDYGYAKAAAGLSLAALLGSWLLADRRLTLGGTVGLCLTIYYAIIGLSAIWSPAPSLTLGHFANGLKYLCVFYLVANVASERRRVETLLHTLAFASMAPALGTIYSWSRGEHLVEGDRAAWIGVFSNPNELAYYLAIGVALTLGAQSLTRRRWLRLGYFGVIATLLAAIALTQSRGGLLATAAVMGLSLLRGMRHKGMLLAVMAVLVLGLQLMPEKTWKRASTTFAYRQDASAQGRIDAWRTGLAMIAARPLTGVGAGAFMLAWPEYAPGDVGEVRTAHNTYVQVASETGLPALALLVGAIALCLWGLEEKLRAEAALERVARPVQIGLVSFLVSSATGGLAFSWPLYLLLGLGAAVIRLDGVTGVTGRAHRPRMG